MFKDEVDDVSMDTDNETLDVETLECDDVPEDITSTEDDMPLICAESQDVIPEDVCEFPEFTESELAENLKRTPINNGEWTGERGYSTWIPEDTDVLDTLRRYDAEGIDYSDGIPDFSKFSAFDIDLDENEFTDTNVHQFQQCNNSLADYFLNLSDEYAGPDCDDPLDNEAYRDAMMNTFKCDEDSLEDIQAALELGETPYGYTWHHSEIPGRMQLIPSDIHDSGRHRGGQSIWGGGSINR